MRCSKAPSLSRGWTSSCFCSPQDGSRRAFSACVRAASNPTNSVIWTSTTIRGSWRNSPNRCGETETYQRVRRGGNLDVVHANIRRVVHVKRMRRARFPILRMNFVMLNENEGELLTFVEQAAERAVDCINCITLATGRASP